MRIGVISDTHGLLRPEALKVLRGVDHILHAGDIGDPGIVAALEALAPVTAIRGNVDRAAWAAAYPEEARPILAGKRILMIHDLKSLADDPAAFNLVLSGHSHRPMLRRAGRTLFLNPGSAGPRRFRLPVTLATATLGASVDVRLHDLV